MKRNRSQDRGTDRERSSYSDRGRRDSGVYGDERRFLRFGSENSEFKDKSVKKWLEMNDAHEV